MNTNSCNPDQSRSPCRTTRFHMRGVVKGSNRYAFNTKRIPKRYDCHLPRHCTTAIACRQSSHTTKCRLHYTTERVETPLAYGVELHQATHHKPQATLRRSCGHPDGSRRQDVLSPELHRSTNYTLVSRRRHMPLIIARNEHIIAPYLSCIIYGPP